MVSDPGIVGGGYLGRKLEVGGVDCQAGQEDGKPRAKSLWHSEHVGNVGSPKKL